MHHCVYTSEGQDYRGASPKAGITGVHHCVHTFEGWDYRGVSLCMSLKVKITGVHYWRQGLQGCITVYSFYEMLGIRHHLC